MLLQALEGMNTCTSFNTNDYTIVCKSNHLVPLSFFTNWLYCI